MTKVLTQEAIQNYRGMFNWDEKGTAWTNYAMDRALNTIEAKGKEIEALKGQVAALVNILENTEFICDCDPVDPCTCGQWEKSIAFENIQQTAQAFESSIREDEREKDAAKAYNAYAYKVHGKSAVLNNITD